MPSLRETVGLELPDVRIILGGSIKPSCRFKEYLTPVIPYDFRSSSEHGGFRSSYGFLLSTTGHTLFWNPSVTGTRSLEPSHKPISN
jgi:hypothetical protein